MKSPELIPLFDLEYDEREHEAVRRVLDRRWLTMGEETQAFEKEFADYIGARHALALCNCTAALHLACLAVGAERGDEIICPSLTFVATANAIRYTGAEPVFADAHSMDDWTLSPEDIERKITPRTKAILVMHYGGFACDMAAILYIARQHGLAVIEDAAHAPGAEWREKKLGAVGDISCFSFFSNKNLSTGEGGMICTDNDVWAEKIRLWRSHGMTSLTHDRHKGHHFTYDVVEQGFNYRTDEIRATLGRVQLAKLDDGNARRCRLADCYKEQLASFPQIAVPFLSHSHKPNYHIFPILLPPDVDRIDCMRRLRERGVQTSIHYRPVHTFEYGENHAGAVALDLTEEIARREITLPMYPALGNERVGRVVEALRDVLETIR